MKPEGSLPRMTTTPLLMIALLLAGLASLSGCMVTNKVLDLRQQREMRTKEATNFWSLSAVRSAHVIAGSEVFACVEFRDSPSDVPQAFTVTVSKCGGQPGRRSAKRTIPIGSMLAGSGLCPTNTL